MIISLIVILFGCDDGNKQKALNKIVNTYGGFVTGKSGYVYTNKKNKLNGRYYQISIDNLDDNLFEANKNLKIPASNMAYMYIKHDSLNSKKCDFVRVIIDSMSIKKSFEYKLSDLNNAKICYSKYVNFVDAVMRNNCSDFSVYFVRNLDDNMRNKLCNKLKSEKIKNIKFIKGYEIIEKEAGYIKVYGIVTAGNKMKELDLVIDIRREHNFIAGLSF